MIGRGGPSIPQLKKASLAELVELAEDLRQKIISTCLKNGGHLGASLGPVELAIALHRVFDSPAEPIIWDVGHQAYAHKLLTGRWDRFSTLRQTGGVSGFLSRDESEHDVFGAGHSSTALSAALGIASTRAQSQAWTVAVVGDGGLTAGLALEALNNVRAVSVGPLLTVLNDNQMSIAPNVGAIPAILAGGEARDFFSHFGFDYVGPIDGHRIDVLLGTLEGIKRGYAGRPVLLHIHTQKGKGYAPAEESPAFFHGVGPLQSKVVSGGPTPLHSFSDEFGKALCRLAEEDPRIVAISAAMPEGTGLTEFSRRFPTRFFDVGIAEPHAVTFAAGLAVAGYRPVVAIYSTFLQRALDSIIHDVAIQRLPVIFAVDRAGLVGADGPTHHGVFDLSYLGMIPGLELTAPACLSDVEVLLRRGLATNAPFALRYPRGSGPESLPDSWVGVAGTLRHLKAPAAAKIQFVSFGASASKALKAVEQVDPECKTVSLWSLLSAKPIPAELIQALNTDRASKLFVLEEGSIRGGVGETMLRELEPRASRPILMGYPDQFVPHGAISDLEKTLGLGAQEIALRLRQEIDA